VHSALGGECTCRRKGCSSQGKHPLRFGWCDMAPSDEIAVDKMLRSDVSVRRYPNGTGVRLGDPTPPNLGIVTGAASGIVVLDIDPRNGGDDALFELERLHGPLPLTPMVLTGSGGWHYYFHLPAGCVVASGTLAQGVDLKAEGGFAVGPGSIHRSGHRYEWEVTSHPTGASSRI
jgi:hypothetical protein